VLIFQLGSATPKAFGGGTVLRLRDQREIEDQNKKPSIPAKRGMKASNESWRKQFDRLAPSFSLTEKLIPHLRDQTSTAKPVS
jgi:hypothetical protein